jgi:hypothetical protein
MRAVLKADGNTPADKDMLTRWEMGPASTSDPILSTATGIPSVQNAGVDLSPAMTFAIGPAFAKLKEKVDGIFPPYLLPFVATSRVLFWTPLPARIFHTFSR